MTCNYVIAVNEVERGSKRKLERLESHARVKSLSSICFNVPRITFAAKKTSKCLIKQMKQKQK